MNRSKLFSAVSLAAASAMLLAACGAATPAPTAVPPTVAPAATAVPATAAPKPTVAPTAAPAAFVGDKLAAPDCNYGGSMKAIEAVDATTVKFTLCAPDPAFPQKITGSSFNILSKDDIAKTGGDAKKIGENPVGTGPYILKEWKHGDSLTFTANPNWWGGAVANKQLVIRWSKEAAQALLELQSGNADNITKVATEDFDTVAKDKNLKLVPVEGLNIFYVGFNVNTPPFDNEMVRQAFAMAIDRAKIVKDYYPEGSTVANGFIPPSFKPGPSPDIKWYDYNADKAKQMLVDAKFDFNQEIPLSYRQVVRVYLPSVDKVAQEIQAQFKKIGVKIKLTPKESGTFIKSSSEGKEPFHLLGWGADYPDATNFIDYHFGAEHKQFGKAFPDILEQIKVGATNSDVAVRQAAYDKINTMLKQHVPVIPVANGYSAQAFRADVTNPIANPVSSTDFWMIKGAKDTFVSVQSGEPISLDCADETDGETFQACDQIFEKLLGFKPGTVELKPLLATAYKANADASEWTFTLRPNVKFSNGAAFTANDVVASFARQWDASNPAHKGDTATFDYWASYFGGFLNAKK